MMAVESMSGRFAAAQGFLSQVWALSYPYWTRSPERWRARGLLALILAMTLGLVYLLVLLNEWNREFYNALERRDFEAFGPLALQFALLAAIYITVAVYKRYFTLMLEMRWRTWLTAQFLDRWFTDQVYYRIELQDRSTDNPDQRIAEDLRLFTTGTLGLSLGLVSELVTLASFVTILWVISGPLEFSLGELAVSVPGYMLWVALVYAFAGSLITHAIGRPLIGLNFQQERLEADFRFNLVRVRENAEGIALYRGEQSERQGLMGRFERVRQNWWQLMEYTKRLTFFTVGYAQIALVFPVLVAAPKYFAGAISLGVLIQIANAFGRVEGALSWFVESYGRLADWKATVDRLLSFQTAMERAETEAARLAGVQVVRNGGGGVRAADLELAAPTGRVILSRGAFTIAPGDRVLVTGPTGSGKTTLFRAVAGIWPFGRGSIQLPAGARILFLPQKPYLPLGALRAAVSYPSPPGAFSDEEIQEALAAVGLAPFGERLDEVQNWSLQLSVGEQQRLAFARALLHRPDWLFLDEATSALDEASEEQLYRLLAERLPAATLVSIAHRPRLAAHHTRGFRLTPNGDASVLAEGEAEASPEPDGSRS